MTYAVLLAYVVIAGWFFWLGTRNGATPGQSLLVSLGWPVAIPLLLAVALWFGGDDNVPDDT
jgi:hypothetical protein